jgi:hypothetical protein
MKKSDMSDILKSIGVGLVFLVGFLALLALVALIPLGRYVMGIAFVLFVCYAVGVTARCK